jgi:tetratricopeptide (TPR) repeat protein
MTDAEGLYRACVASDPNWADAYYNLSMIRVQLGEYADALVNIEHANQLNANPDWQPDLLAIRYLNGKAGKDEMERAVANEYRPLAIATYLYPLVDHPDPAQRDPAFVLRALRERGSVADLSDWQWLVTMVAQIRLQDWPGALAAVEGHFTSPDALVVTPNCFDFMRSLIYSHLGRLDEARDYYARAMIEWNRQTGGNPAAWEHSDVMRWRREAEALLKK